MTLLANLQPCTKFISQYKPDMVWVQDTVGLIQPSSSPYIPVHPLQSSDKVLFKILPLSEVRDGSKYQDLLGCGTTSPEPPARRSESIFFGIQFLVRFEDASGLPGLWEGRYSLGPLKLFYFCTLFYLLFCFFELFMVVIVLFQYSDIFVLLCAAFGFQKSSIKIL